MNEELAVRVLAQIEREPATWRQSYWATRTECGTAYCFAGWVCVLSGETVERLTVPGTRTESTDAGKNIHSTARNLLDVNYGFSDKLFFGGNTLDDLYRLVAGKMGVEPEVLRDKVQDLL